MWRKGLLYIMGLIFLISWSLGFLFFHADSLIHALLVFSLILCLQAITMIPQNKHHGKILKSSRKKSRKGNERNESRQAA